MTAATHPDGTPYAKGDRFTWMGSEVTVLRVSRDGTWADIDCKPVVGASWTKRQPLPMPEEAFRMSEYPEWVEKLSGACGRGEDGLCTWPVCGCPCHEGRQPHSHPTDLDADTCPICFPGTSPA